MDLELRLDPEDAARLPRLRMLTASEHGRAQVRRIIWHDSPDSVLAHAGLALAHERGTWRLERLAPGADAWPPGMPPPILEQAAERTELTHRLPELLAPAAAFDGRLQSYTVASAHGAVSVGLLRGRLRAVTAEHPVSRLLLSGEEPAVLAVALALAGDLQVEVPSATLAAEALAVARGAPPPPRRLHAPELPEAIGVADACAYTLGHLTDVILHFAPAAAADEQGPEPVHQMRVAVRRMRSSIAVFRRALGCPELDAANAGLKTLGTRLAPARDWDVFVTETAPVVVAAFPHDPHLARLIAAADRRRSDGHAALREYLLGAEFRRLGIELAWLAAARCWWPSASGSEPEDAAPEATVAASAVPEDAATAEPADAVAPAEMVASAASNEARAAAEPAGALREFAAAVLRRRLRKLVGADEDIAALDPPALHGLRLRAKRLRYAAEIFTPLYSAKAARRFLHRLSDLQDHLGRMNDVATAASLLADLGVPGGRHAYAGGLVLGVAGAGTSELRPQIGRAWERFRRVDPFWE